MKLALVSLAAVLAAPIAVAHGNLELSGGYSQFDEDGAELGALTGRGTYFFNRYLGAEGEVSIGIDDAAGTPLFLHHFAMSDGVIMLSSSE